MTDQLTLALADRHAGQAANLAAGTRVHTDDRTRVEEAVAAEARTGAPFTADHIHQRLGTEQPYDRNLVSSVMGHWTRDGRLREFDELRPTPSAHRTRKGSRNRWWIGAGHVPEARRG